MPTLWYVKDGPRPDNTRGAGIQVLFLELRGAFGNHTLEFLSKNPPQFNVKEPSLYPRRVVIEVQEEDGLDGKFSQPGFYLFPDLSPEEAHRLLNDSKKQKI